METENRQEALRQLLDLAAAKGYVTFDDIFECSEAFSLSIGDLDWLSESAATRNIIIYETEPSAVDIDSDDHDDFAQVDYEETFQAIVEAYPDLAPVVDEIRSIKPPQRGEVSRLKYQVKEGNAHARMRMIEMYMRIALRIAWQRSQTFDLDLEDTLSDAFIGLTIAVDKYDPDHSGPFISYASMWIFQNIQREQCTRNHCVYFPVHRREPYYIMYPLLKDRGCTECDKLISCPKVREMIRNRVECDDDEVDYIIMATISPVSVAYATKLVRRCDYIYETTGEKVSFPEEAWLKYDDDEILDKAHSSGRIKRVMEKLNDFPERNRDIILWRYGFKDGKEHTLEEVGQIFDLTRERVRQLEQKYLRKLEVIERRKPGRKPSSNMDYTMPDQAPKRRGRPPKKKIPQKDVIGLNSI